MNQVKGKLKRLEGRVREGTEVVVILLNTKREGCHRKRLKEKELEIKKAECDAQAEMFKTMQQLQAQNMQNVLLQQQQQQNQTMMSLLQQILLKETNSF